MAYYRPRKPPENAPEQPAQYPSAGSVWDLIRAPMAGLYQGLLGKNLDYDAYIRERARKKKGLPPGSYPGRGPISWLGRTMTGK